MEEAMTAYVGRPFSPIESQVDMMKAHVTRGVPIATRTAGERTLQMAVPAGWTAQARCIPDPTLELHERKRIHALYDEIARITRPGEAASACEGCPVVAQCLAAAMDEEKGLSAHYRHGIRGGKSPKERALLEFSARVCEQGHRDRWSSLDARRAVCLECNPSYDEDQRKAKADQLRRRDAVQQVSCLECGETMRSRFFARHLERRHSNNEETAA
jgi:hypothetical protein